MKRHSHYQTFIKALLEIAVEANFADQGALRDIVVAFNDLRVNLVNALNTDTADEAAAQSAYEARVIQLNSEHAEFQRAVLIKNAEIEANANKIEATDELIDQLEADLAALNG